MYNPIVAFVLICGDDTAWPVQKPQPVAYEPPLERYLDIAPTIPAPCVLVRERVGRFSVFQRPGAEDELIDKVEVGLHEEDRPQFVHSNFPFLLLQHTIEPLLPSFQWHSRGACPVTH